ncbi:MAG: tryptophan 7-halogenase [Paraglaciecola sp.]|nr:tryptophan 7-halogenase [Paraglaciecola sp.]
MSHSIKSVVIAGGGTAGWMTAALLSKVLGCNIDITLIESDDIGAIGVGEATIPTIQAFNQYLALDEKEFLAATKGSIKLAIKFENWRKMGESYFHTFGAPGANLGFCNFQHYWLKAKAAGLTQSLWDFDFNYLCCLAGKFNKIQTTNSVHDLNYAYHFDSALYAKLLRSKAEAHGVTRVEGLIEHISRDAISGNITQIILQNGESFTGDLFIDCTGLKSLLLRQTMGVKFQSWQHWLPANRAIAVPTERAAATLPYTCSTAHKVGWQWRIPLTHRNGNGLVYSSDYISDDEAWQQLSSNLTGKMLAEPRTIRFETGKTVEQWHKNVVAIGLSSGFLEPLESTSIHLIQSALVRLLKLFPHQGLSDEAIFTYNQESATEIDTIRDFIILHYFLNERGDSPFWRDMANLNLPERLAHKIKLFRKTAHITNDPSDIFRDASWLEVMLGQGVMPEDHHPAANAVPIAQLQQTLAQLLAAKQEPLAQMLSHDAFLERYLRA